MRPRQRFKLKRQSKWFSIDWFSIWAARVQFQLSTNRNKIYWGKNTASWDNFSIQSQTWLAESVRARYTHLWHPHPAKSLEFWPRAASLDLLYENQENDQEALRTKKKFKIWRSLQWPCLFTFQIAMLYWGFLTSWKETHRAVRIGRWIKNLVNCRTVSTRTGRQSYPGRFS